jgi:hypothetical protein
VLEARDQDRKMCAPGKGLRLIRKIGLHSGLFPMPCGGITRSALDGRMADLQAEMGMRADYVMIVRIETKREDWFFGRGEAPYA